MDRAQGDASSIGWRETAAYAWPFRHLLDRAGPIGLARMVPDSEHHPSTSVLDDIGRWVESWQGPAALVWGSRDPILGRALRRHREALPQASVTETRAGHFLQEEVPDAIAVAIREVAERIA
jgi:haloalkane dehalogenase